MAAKLPPIKIPIVGVDEFSKTFKEVGRNAQAWGKGFASVGKTMTMAVTLPVVAMGAAAIKIGADFETAMNQVGQESNASARQLEAMKKAALDIGSTGRAGPKGAAEAMLAMAENGASAEQAIAGLRGAIALAEAENKGFGESTQAAMQIVKAYGMSAGDMGGIADQMAQAFMSGSVTLDYLSTAMQTVGPVAATMGISFAETTAALGLMADAGIEASAAGAALKMALVNLTKPSSAAVKTFKDLGINKGDILDSAGNVRSLTAVMTELEAHGASSADVLTIFGNRGGPALANLLGKGAKGLRDLSQSISAAAGTGGAAELANQNLAGFNGKLKALRASAEGLAIKIAESGLLDMATGLVDKVARLVGWLKDANPGLMKLGLIAVGLAATLGPLALIIGQIGMSIAGISLFLASPAFAAAAPTIAKIATALGATQPTIAGIAGSLALWAPAILGAVAAVGLFVKKLADAKMDAVAVDDAVEEGVGTRSVLGAFGAVGRRPGTQLGAPLGATQDRQKMQLGAPLGATETARQASPQIQRSRVQIDVKSDRPGVSARVTQGNGVDLTQEMGLLLVGG